MPKKILIVKLSSLGDILRASFMPKLIKNTDDQITVEWLVMKHCSALINHNPYVDQTLLFPETKKEFLLKGPVFLYTLWKKKYDTVIIAHRAPLLSFLCWALRIPHRIGFKDSRNNPWLTESVVFHTNTPLTQLEHLLVEKALPLSAGQTCEPIYKYTEKDQVPNIPSPCITVAPGGGKNRFSSMESRRWQHYDALIQELRLHYPQYSVMILGDANDATEIENYECLSQPGVISLCGKLSIPQNAYVLSKSAGFIGNDSMLLYLALSQNIKSIGIFGPTSGLFCVSDTPNAVYLQSKSPCSPCYNPIFHASSFAYNCPYGIKCMAQDITVEQVLEKIKTTLNLG